MVWGVIGIGAAAAGAVAALARLQDARFERRVAHEARELWRPGGPGPVDRSLDGLPAAVRRYLDASGAARRAAVRSVRLRHGGSIRLDGRWRAVRGVQYFGLGPPGFVWRGRVRVAPGLSVVARDRSIAGEGQMLVRVASTFTVADARGPALDQGALSRLLAEMVWFPTAFLDARWVSWTAAGDEEARATLRVGGREAAVTFRFGPDGLPSGFRAERYRDVAGRSVLTPWLGDCGDYREVDGLRVPFRIEVSWVLDGEPRPDARWVLEALEYDRGETW